MTADQLLRQLNETDEHVQVEAKSIQNNEVGRSVLETICAFSNEPGLGGGWIILGVAATEKTLFDTCYEALGLSQPEKIQSDLATQCANVFNQRIRPRITVEVVKHRNVVVVQVSEASPSEKPIYFKKDGLPAGAFRRVGPTDERCTEEDMLAFFQGRQVDSFDEQIISESAIQHLDQDALAQYRATLSTNSPQAEVLRCGDEEMLIAIGCAKRRGENILLTVAGIVLFGTKLALRRFFPLMRVDYIVSPTREWIGSPDAGLNCIEFREPLVTLIPKVRSLIIGDLPTLMAVREGDVQRKDESLLPDRALREAIVNAVMHRSYRDNSPIQVIRYPNRLEIRNAGYSLKSEELFGRPGSNPRNPKISSVLHEMKLAEEKGMGIRLMQRLMVEERGLAPPFIESNRPGNQFSVFFLFHHFFSEDDLSALAKFRRLGLEDDEPRALIFAKEMGAINNFAFRSFSGLDSVAASARLRRLRNHGLLEKKKHGSATYYVPTEKLLSAWSDKPSESSDKPSELDSDGSELAAATLALPAELRPFLALGAKAEAKRIKIAILKLCSWRDLGSAELASYLGRTQNFVRQEYLSPLLEMKYLELPPGVSRNSPSVAYRTTAAGVAWSDKQIKPRGRKTAQPMDDD